MFITSLPFISNKFGRLPLSYTNDIQKRKETIKVCHTCGDGEQKSDLDPLIYCNKCKIVAEHTYCVPPWRKQGEDVWACRDCTLPSTTTTEDDDDALDWNKPIRLAVLLKRHAMRLTMTSMLRILIKGGKLCLGTESFWKFLPSLPMKEDSSFEEYCSHKNVMDVLPDELLDEILCRLPSSKSVYGCKAVCKRWLTIISSTQFRQRFLLHQHGIQNNNYIARNSNSVSLLVYSDDHILSSSYFLSPTLVVKGSSTIWEFSIEFLEHFLYKITGDDLSFGEGRVIAVCNDLVLCSRENWGSLFPGGRKQSFLDLYLCNAQTKEFIMLPRTELFKEFQAGLICTSVLNAHYRYRVVIVNFRSKFINQRDAYIYLSETREWKEVVLNFPSVFGLGCFFDDKVLVYDGMIVFVNRRHGMVALDPFSEYLLEAGEECAIECSYAYWPIDIIRAANVSICQGRIRMLQNSYMPNNDTLRVWDLVDFGKSEWRCHEYKVGQLRDFDMDNHYLSADGVGLRRFFGMDDHYLLADGNTSVQILGAHPLCDDGFFLMTKPLHCRWACDRTKERKKHGWVFYCNLKLKKLELVSKISDEEQFDCGVICYCLMLQPWPTHIPSERIGKCYMGYY